MARGRAVMRNCEIVQRFGARVAQVPLGAACSIRHFERVSRRSWPSLEAIELQTLAWTNRFTHYSWWWQKRYIISTVCADGSLSHTQQPSVLHGTGQPEGTSRPAAFIAEP